MQLQRLRDPRPRTFLNKIEQAIRAKQLEKHATKQAILVEYLNRAPFGGNLTGVGAASWRYFAKPCSELSLAQAALLAGLPQSRRLSRSLKLRTARPFAGDAIMQIAGLQARARARKPQHRHRETRGVLAPNHARDRRNARFRGRGT